MPFELFVALRFLREGRAQTALVLGGATVGVGVIVFLTALIGGLQATLVEQTLGSQAHVVLRRPERVPRVLPPGPGEALAAVVEKIPERDRSVEQWPEVLALVRGAPGVVSATPTAAGSAFASRAGVSRAVALRGVEPESFDRVIPMSRRMKAGAFRAGGEEVVIGAVLADELGLAVGDKLRITSAESRSDLFTVAGVFDLGSRDVNQRWVLVSLRAAQTLLDLQGGITGIELKVRDPFAAERVARSLAARTGLLAESWMQLNQQLLTALRSQSASSLLIQSFVVLAVALGIASVLGISVIQRSREIGILKATGTTTGTVLRIFLIEGALVGGAGSVLGALLGTAMSVAFATLVRNPYGEALFPVELTPGLFLLASAVAVGTGLVAAAYPARRAAKLDPAVVIRYG
ncbi:ABC transporter permease [Anaeromyxobacter dehalogenans]|uniref:ABC transporter, inner membrane subunit n=1 Tax=Anaeromyxobacter dehalogenans (strain 2CP-C) TaxID=290397 RepID=Q2IF16_ANADE|nr:ABC transporter permease [Anaeromyxobacter dehalogenans]ABC83178.1 ABC transporter, inner membrane subunit [Anaeromyxobacter dehalogenans 2CP-C]